MSDPKQEKPVRHYAFFQNRECESFPCHKGIPEEEFNCLFCYCPLYPLGRKCGGNCYYTAKGIKSCLNCTFPHWRDNYDKVLERFSEVAALAAEPPAETEQSE